MKFREVFRWEFVARLRSPSTCVFAAALFFFAFWINLGFADIGPVDANAPSELARGTVVIGLLGLLVTAALFGGAAVRDIQFGADPLLYTSSVSTTEYLGGRFLAALAVNALVLLAIPLGLLATMLAGLPDPAAFGPLRIAAYLQPYGVFALPNVIFAGSVLFTAGVMSRHMIPVYLSAIALFAGYLLTLGAAEAVEHPVLSVLLDPTGIRALTDQTRFWTPAEQNEQLLGLSGGLLANRLVWMSLGAAVLGGLHRAFRFTHPDAGGSRLQAEATVLQAVPDSLRVPRVVGSFGSRTAIRQSLTIAGDSLRDIVSSRWFVVTLLGCTGLTMLWGWNVAQTVFDTETWPVTLLVAETVLSQRTAPLLSVLIALYAGELVWKDREAGVSEIADAAPVTDGVALLGRFLALVVLLLAMQIATVAGGVLIQALQGYFVFEPTLYLRIVFGLNMADLLLWAALATTIYVVVNHKNLGHLVVLVALLFLGGLGRALGVRHNLLLYGGDPGWTYSDMNGFGPFIEPFLWFKLYWAAWALLLAMVAALFWVRGRETGSAARLGQARLRFRGPALHLSVLAFCLIAGLGGFVFYNTNVLNEYRPLALAGEPQADMELRYGQWRGVPQPAITDVDLRIEIHPDERTVDLSGTYRLANQTNFGIDSVHVLLPVTEARSLDFDRPTEVVVEDDAIGYYVFELAAPLQPGDSIQLDFDVAYRTRGFPNTNVPTDVARNGAYFDRRWLPFIGYQPGLELVDARDRERLGLPSRPPTPASSDADALSRRYDVTDSDLVNVSTVIGTDADQTAVTPGTLVRRWTEDGRHYFHYRSEGPISFGAAVFSARYDIREDEWNGIDLAVFHHPTHTRNLDPTIQGMKAALEYYTENFGPYRGTHLRVVETPRYGGFGRAHPGTIAFTEDYFFARASEDDFDSSFYGTAHEVAHMWWGGQVRSARVLGAGFLSESLANFSAMMVVEGTFGPAATRRIRDAHMERYLRGRASAAGERPVLEVDDGQAYLAYRKGAVVLYSLRQIIGEEAMNSALRRYVEKYSESGPPFPTAYDLYSEIRAETPERFQGLLTDLFETVTLWEMEAAGLTVEATGSGDFEVTLRVDARKVRADAEGSESEVPMDDLVQIGLYTGPAMADEPAYLGYHRVRSGVQTIRIVVPEGPTAVVVDPNGLLIERDRSDNRSVVESR